MDAAPETSLFFSREYLQPALLISLLSVWVLVGLFFYLNRYTRRRYFTIWTAAWLFYALWLTLGLTFPESASGRTLLMVKQWCVGTAAVFLLWGAMRFLRQRISQRVFGLFLLFLFFWSYVAAFHGHDQFWIRLSVFLMMGGASGLAAVGFYQCRRKRNMIGAGLLSAGFFLWGGYLVSYPFLEKSPHLAGAGFFLSAALQLFIAVSMIILVLEEARQREQQIQQRLQAQTEEKRELSNQVLSSEERYRSLFELASEGIVIVESESLRILDINETARKLLGVSLELEELPSLAMFINWTGPVDGRPASGAEWSSWIFRQPRIELLRQDGTVFPAEITGAPVNFEGQAGCQLFIREITEKLRLEEQLRQAEKLSAMGRMISGVSHELNNPLAVVKGYLELVLSHHSIASQTRKDLEKAALVTERASVLVQKFLSFSRSHALRREARNLNDLILHTLEPGKENLLGDVDLKLELAPALPDVEVNAGQMEQVLINLVQNATHAMKSLPGPHCLTVATHDLGDAVLWTISDTGTGIPEEIAGKIFEPFFTTKQVGAGAGLGLSIVHSILAEHEARITCQSSPDRGATFLIEIPALHQPPDSTFPSLPFPESLNATSGKSGRILIVDDEPSIAEMLGEMLEVLGHETRAVFSAAHALELIEQEEFDLILSDFRMPTLDGRDFYLRLQQVKPVLATRIIFLTGDLVNDNTRAFLQSTGNRCLPKPFHLHEVKQAVATALEKIQASTLECEPLVAS
jgi:PAS domain S-box-containing protein